MRQKVAGNPDALLKVLHTDSLDTKHSTGGWVAILYVLGATEFCGVGMRAGEMIVPLRSLPHV